MEKLKQNGLRTVRSTSAAEKEKKITLGRSNKQLENMIQSHLLDQKVLLLILEEVIQEQVYEKHKNQVLK